MPPSVAIIHKGPTLRVIDAFVKTANDQDMEEILNGLNGLDPVNPGLVDFARAHPTLGFAGPQLDHLEKHWFNTDPNDLDAYWPNLKFVEAIFFKGLRKAVDLSVNDLWGNLRSPHLPLDSYWLMRGCDFKVAVMLNDEQRVTMLVMTPIPTGRRVLPTVPENIWLAQAGLTGAQIGQVQSP